MTTLHWYIYRVTDRKILYARGCQGIFHYKKFLARGRIEPITLSMTTRSLTRSATYMSPCHRMCLVKSAYQLTQKMTDGISIGDFSFFEHELFFRVMLLWRLVAITAANNVIRDFSFF